MNWKRLLRLSITIAVVSFFVIYLSGVAYHSTQSKQRGYGLVDFAVFYVAGSTLTPQLEFARSDLYVSKVRMAVIKSIRKQSGGTRYLYPPQAVFFFAPFAVLPFAPAAQLWSILIAGAFLASYYITIRFLLNDDPLRLRYAVLLLLLVFSDPIQGLMGTGQINSFILLGMILTLYGMQRNRWVLSGVSLGVVITLKIFPVVLLPYLLLKKQWKASAVTVATVLFLWLASLPVFGWQATDAYVHRILPMVTSGSFIGSGTSLYGSLTTAIKQDLFLHVGLSDREAKAVVTWIRLVLMFFTAGVSAFFMYRRRHSVDGRLLVTEYGIILLFVLLFSKSIHTQYHFFLLPLFLSLLSVPATWQYWKSFTILAITLAFTHFRSWFPFPPQTLLLLFKPGTFGMIILLIWQLIRLAHDHEDD